MRVTLERMQAVTQWGKSPDRKKIIDDQRAKLMGNREVYDYLIIVARSLAGLRGIENPQQLASTIIEGGIQLAYLLGLTERSSPVISKTYLNRYHDIYIVQTPNSPHSPQNDPKALVAKLQSINEPILALALEAIMEPKNSPHLTELERCCMILVTCVVIESALATWRRLN